MHNLDIAYAGVQIVAKLLNFPAPKLFIIEQDQLHNKEITGMYKFDDNEIIFNEDWVLRSEWIEVMITAYHEMRHAYQGYCIRTKSRESAETLSIWEHETLNYKTPSGKNNEIDDRTYLSQEIEIDAIAYAHWIVKSQFDMKTVIPSNIKERVLARIEEINTNCITNLK